MFTHTHKGNVNQIANTAQSLKKCHDASEGGRLPQINTPLKRIPGSFLRPRKRTRVPQGDKIVPGKKDKKKENSSEAQKQTVSSSFMTQNFT